MKQNFHIGIMGNLFSGKTTLMHALARDPYKRDLETLLDGAEVHAFSERVDKGSLIDECLALFYHDRVANIFPTELAFLHMRTMQQREIRHLMTRESPRGVIIIEDRPFIDGPDVFVARMIESGEMPAAHGRLYRTLFHQTLRAENIRLPDLTVYLRTKDMEFRNSKCRSCEQPGLETFLDLGWTPLADRLLTAEKLEQPDPTYPLEVAFCHHCSLVQILETVPPELLFCDDYPYYSSFSQTLLKHSRENVLDLIESRKLNSKSLVVELASNDGYLLQHFVEAGVPCLGVEPAINVAEAAHAKGIPTTVRFFGQRTARELVAEFGRPDLLLGNNVLAHVPDLNDFVAGMKFAPVGR